MDGFFIKYVFDKGDNEQEVRRVLEIIWDHKDTDTSLESILEAGKAILDSGRQLALLYWIEHNRFFVGSNEWLLTRSDAIRVEDTFTKEELSRFIARIGGRPFPSYGGSRLVYEGQSQTEPIVLDFYHFLRQG